MKHFFFPYKENSNLLDKLHHLLDKKPYRSQTSNQEEFEILKICYDVTDIIYDKRFDHGDKQLEYFSTNLKELLKQTADSDIDKYDSDKKEPYRLPGLKLMWNAIEKRYQAFAAHTDEILYKKSSDAEHINRQYDTSIQLALYHLVRGNLCLRISLCYYDNFDLNVSDSWANRGIEILWHGKNLLASLRDSAVSEEKKIQADLYLRLTKLNLAKYYRDYARKNRRSDFDAALDEYKQVRRRVEEEYNHVNNKNQKRQYALIWMDTIIDIVKIHRRKYQVNTSEREMLFLYSCLKNRLQENSDEQTSEIQILLEKADQVIWSKKGLSDITDAKLQASDKDLTGLKRESFQKYNDLEPYDKKRYFLLVLLELARIRRDLHFVDNYKSAIATAIIADQWSRKLDEKGSYIPGNNIDALITISSSLRKYIKFQNNLNNEEPPLKEITIKIEENEYKLTLSDRPSQKDKAITLPSFIEKLNYFADNGDQKSKAEVFKWHCLYLQEPELLDTIKEQANIEPFKKEKSNCQLQFLLGLAALRSEKYEEAIMTFTNLLKQNEKEMRYIRLGTLGLKVRYLLANCYMSQAEFSKAEKILKNLHDILAVAKKSRQSQALKKNLGKQPNLQEQQTDTLQQAKENTDADPDARIEIDLGYCYMQRGAYEEAIEIYKNLYGDGGCFPGQEPYFGLENVKQLRRIMGLNNYASCCIFSINDAIKHDAENKEADEKSEAKIRKEALAKIEIARKIFCYMDNYFLRQKNEKKAVWYEWNPETNLLKGYYTLCTGKEPGTLPVTDEQSKICLGISETEDISFWGPALLKAFPYFRKACRFEEAFPSRYDLLDEHDIGNKARYRNEVERISVYIIALTKLHKLYLSKQEDIKKLIVKWEQAKEQETMCGLFNNKFKISKLQLQYLTMSKQALERFLLSFPANYKISLKAAISLAEWLLDSDTNLKLAGNENQEVSAKARNLQSQLYRSFSYITIYEERGAGVFNTLKDNSQFRFFNAAQRGKFCALLLAMYKPIKVLKEECCFNAVDKKNTPNLVHYTSTKTLKKILTEEPQKEVPTAIQKEHRDMENPGPRFRINNCGYMNDVFEGKTFLKSIALILGDIQSMNDPMRSSFIEKYFPQINRSHKNLLPSGSNVYIGSLSVKADSFPMWSVYSEKESGCNIEFGNNFFDIDGIPYLPNALRDYMLSKYTDQDYPLYIVQYIGSKFETIYKDYAKNNKFRGENYETFHSSRHQQDCGTEAIRYTDLFRILQQITWRWQQLENYLQEVQNAVSESKDVIRAFAADRINEIRFLFKDADYEYEGEVRVLYTDSSEYPVAKNNTESEVPCVYVNIERELENLTIRLGSRIEDAIVDKYVTWLKHTKRVDKIVLAKQNRYTT